MLVFSVNIECIQYYIHCKNILILISKSGKSQLFFKYKIDKRK